MDRRKLYIILLIPALLLVVAGILLFFFSAPAVTVPEGPPIIAMRVVYTMRGEIHHLSIYKDGTIIYAQDMGLRPLGDSYRIWRTGKLTPQELGNLAGFFQESGFTDLNDIYSYSEIPNSDMDSIISIDHEGTANAVRAQGYLSADDDMTYPDMPYPLNEAYRRLRNIAENRTAEVARESI